MRIQSPLNSGGERPRPPATGHHAQILSPIQPIPTWIAQAGAYHAQN